MLLLGYAPRLVVARNESFRLVLPWNLSHGRCKFAWRMQQLVSGLGLGELILQRKFLVLQRLELAHVLVEHVDLVVLKGLELTRKLGDVSAGAEVPRRILFCIGVVQVLPLHIEEVLEVVLCFFVARCAP